MLEISSKEKLVINVIKFTHSNKSVRAGLYMYEYFFNILFQQLLQLFTVTL